MLAAPASGAAWPARCCWMPAAPLAMLVGRHAPEVAAHCWRPADRVLCQRSPFSFCACKAYAGASNITCNQEMQYRGAEDALILHGKSSEGCSGCGAQSNNAMHGSRDDRAHGLLASLWKANFKPFCGTAAPGVHSKPLLRGPSTMPALLPRFSSLHLSSWMRLICAVTSSMPSSFTVYAQYRPEPWILGSA